MVSASFTALGLAATILSTSIVSAQNNQVMQVIWSSGHFSTISGPTGNEHGHSNGFAVTDGDGVELYSESYPGDYSPCMTGDGRSFTLTSTCWSRERKFKCVCNLGGNPESCEVRDSGDNVLSSAEGNTETNFIGIAIAQEGACGTSFLLEADEHCDDQAEWTVS